MPVVQAYRYSPARPATARQRHPNARSVAATKTKPQARRRRGNPYTRAVPVLIAIIALFAFFHHRAEAATSSMHSGFSGYCLDIYHDKTAPDATVDLWTCNHTAAQAWSAFGLTLKNDDRCLTLQADHVVLSETCSGGPAQVWLSTKGGFLNPDSGLCLNARAQKSGTPINAASCANLVQPNGIWTLTTQRGQTFREPACAGTEGQKVACFAAKEWTTWQSGTPSHETLLNAYTDGTPYEEWCADFVSYVYKEAGYPFTAGESDGWDENVAANIQNMGFTRHDTNAGYVPQPGDVAYFNYNGGHVEIVASGGPHPTFIYGNSGTTDPATGNGQMATNAITNDPSEGYLMYYLSPNHN